MDTIKLERSESSDSEEFGGRTPESSSHVDQPSTSSCHWIKLETDNIIDIQAPEKEEFYHHNESKTFQEQLTDETGRLCNKEITKTHERPLHFDQPSSSKFKWVQSDDRDMGDVSDPVFLIDGQEKSENITKSESDYSLLACNVKLESNDSMGELCHGDSKDVIGDSKNCTDHVIDGERNWKTEDGILSEDCVFHPAKKEVGESTCSDSNSILEEKIGQTPKFENSIETINESAWHDADIQQKKYDMISDIDVVCQKKKIYKCNFCDYTAIKRFFVQRHIDSVHLKKKNHKCHMCDYAAPQKSYIQSHIRNVHLNEKKHKCDMCDYAAGSKSTLQRHIDRVHLKLKYHMCHLCDFTGVQKCDVKRHIDSVHLKKKKKNQKCPMCDYATSHRNLQAHIKRVHNEKQTNGDNEVRKSDDKCHINEKNHECHMCDYATSLKGNLQTHIKQVHLNERNHKCDMCDFAAVHKCSLKQHIEDVHMEIKRHVCQVCGFTASRKYKLKFHISSVHLEEENYKCDMCDYTAVQKDGLQHHIDRVHTKKNFRCHMCDYTAVQKIVLKRHIDGVHLKINKEKCHMCEYSTTTKSKLQAHVSGVHLREKNYKCHICDFETAQKSNLARHIKDIHLKIKEIICPVRLM